MRVNRSTAVVILGISLRIATAFSAPPAPGLLRRFRAPSHATRILAAPHLRGGDSSVDEMDSAPARKTKVIKGVREIADNFDAFILDQYGVLHNGQEALPNALECFNELLERGKKLVVLSNTSRRAKDASAKLPKMGFDVTRTFGLVCSGEEAYKNMNQHRRGQKVLWLTWAARVETDGRALTNFLDGLDLTLADVEDADFILCHGSDTIQGAGDPVLTEYQHSGDMSKYKETLEIAFKRGIPMLCANPDVRAKMPGGDFGHMPGGIAQLYEDMGGAVTWFGKPHTQHFDASVRLLNAGHEGEELRVCHVGDSLQHDIEGANSADLDCLLIGGGIHAEDLGLEDGGEGVLKSATVAKLQGKHDIHATYACRAFCW
mmetsp:Transcript_4467/g.8761  ORF Transcript_4467/g.8761 Transcript_4467/m.8761 type:complete len:375 (+) Transcript_4467:127-1251(+)